MVPLLPSYVFVSLKPQHHPRLYYYPGIVTVVSFEGKPCAIREEEIRLMERIVMSGYPVQQTVHVTAGDNVRIVRGPLRGWEGRVDAMRGQSRITFQFDSIRQSISVEVNKQDIQIIWEAERWDSWGWFPCALIVLRANGHPSDACRVYSMPGVHRRGNDAIENVRGHWDIICNPPRSERFVLLPYKRPGESLNGWW